MFKIIINHKILLMMLLILVSGCHDSGEPWRITVGLDKPKKLVFIDGDEAREVRVCLDKQGGSGYPTRVVARFDDKKYTPMLPGQCMFFVGKHVSVSFPNPSSGKFAEGTYTIIQK
ncbi:MAG: hypothetical protein AB8C40_00655 [Gammaproteobacteria bacterium]